MQDILQVGAVTSTHGLVGEVKVFPTTDDPKRFKQLKTVLLEDKQSHFQKLEVEHVKFFKNLVIVKFRGLDRIEDVEAFRGCALYVTRENAVKLEEGEYFIADLIGMSVWSDESWNEADEKTKASAESPKEEPDDSTRKIWFLGELTDVLQTGANDVYEVTLADHRQVLIPAIRQCILDVDLENNKMLVHLLEGLLE